MRVRAHNRVSVYLGVLILFAALSVASCGGDSTGPQIKEPTVVPVAAVSVSIARTAFRVGESLQAAALPVDSVGAVLTGRDVIWTSTNRDVATVSSAGLVNGVGPGLASIVAEVEGKKGEVVLQISLVPVSSVTVTPPSQTISSGASLTFSAILKDSAGRTLTGRPVSWTSTAPSIAAVNDEGIVTGALVGNTEIVATSEGRQGRASVAVTTLNTPVATITLDPGATGMSGGATKQLAATLRDAAGNILGGRNIAWSSSNSSRATVTASGPSTAVVTSAPVDGPVVITATTEGQTATSSIDIVTFVRMSSGSNFSCGLTADGSAYCWGENTSGQLGDGTTISRGTPARVATETRFSTIASGTSHSCGIALNGSAHCWGLNTAGQIGNATTSNSLIPARVSGGHAFVSIAPASQSTCATTDTAEVYCWGRIPSTDPYGSLLPRIMPEPVQIGSGMVAVVASANSEYCSVDSAGLAYCWTLQYYYPFSGPVVPPIREPVSTNLHFTTVRVAANHACGLVQSGHAYCWGSQIFGQLGDGGGAATNQSTPYPVVGGLVFESLAVGSVAHSDIGGQMGGFTCGVTVGGKAYCWGSNYYAQLGSGPYNNGSVNSPQPVAGGINFTGLRAGADHVCGLAVGGAAYCWGDNSRGELGSTPSGPSYGPIYVFGK